MKEVFGTSSVIEEGRADARQKAREGRKPGRNFIFSILITLLVYIIAQVIMSLAMGCYMAFDLMRTTDITQDFSFTLDSNDLMTSNSVIVMLYSEIVMIIAFFICARAIEKRKLTSLGFVKKNMVPSYLIGIAGGIGFMLVDALICKFTDAMTFKYSGISVIKLVLFAGGWMIQGLAEEVMCRGYLLTSISRRYSVTLAVVANSVLFALLHIFNPSGMNGLALFNLFLYGVFASLLFLRSGNIWLCAGFHSAWNMMQGNVLGIPVSGINVESIYMSSADLSMGVVNGGAFGFEGGIGVTLLLLIGCIILMITRSKNCNSPLEKCK